MKSIFKKLSLFLGVFCVMLILSTSVCFASQPGNLDDLQGGTPSQNTTGDRTDTKAVSDYLKGYEPVNSENMASAATVASPIVNVLGTVTGVIIMIVSAGIFVVTALDLCYIGLPFTRSLLNPELNAGAGAGAMGGMGGMGMGGMGMGRMGMGRMGGMGMQGGGGQMPEEGLRRKWVSDEAVACVNFANQQNGAGAMGGGAPMGGMGMGGMGMGGMGGMGMGGMGGAQPAQPVHTKSIIFMYLKKRMFFLIIFALATIILTSSILTDCGINLATLVTKIFTKINGSIGNVNI